MVNGVNSTEEAKKPKVVIVGGGTAGLAAAHTLLVQHGDMDVTVLEAADQAGGRMLGEVRDGFHIDLGATIFLEAYRTVPKLAESLGVPLHSSEIVKSALIYAKGRFWPLHFGGSLGDTLRTARTILSFGIMSPRALLQFLRLIRKLKSRDSDLDVNDYSKMLDLDTDESITAHMAANGMSEYLEQMGQIDVSAYTCGNPEQVGAGFAKLLIWRYSLDPSSRLKVPEKGIGSFSAALADACADVTRLSSPVARVVLKDGKATGVVTADGAFEAADAVICATPATVAREIIPDLPPDLRSVLGKVTYSSACIVCLALDDSLFPDRYFLAAFPRRSGAMMGLVVNIKAVYPKAVPEGRTLLHVAMFAEHGRQLFPLSDEEIVERVVAELRKYFPSMPRRPIFGTVRRWNEAVCQCPGGMLTAVHDMRSNGSLDQVRGLFLAGDYMRFPVTDGAMQSGVEAAEACASWLSGRDG